MKLLYLKKSHLRINRKKVAMKHLLLFLLLTSKLLSAPNLEQFTLPEDLHHFIYYLNKAFSKKTSSITISTSNFHLTQLHNTIIQNRKSHFKLFISSNTAPNRLIQSLALYPHISIFLCKEISQNSIYFDHKILKSKRTFSYEKLSKYRQTIQVQKLTRKEKKALIFLSKQCYSY